MMNNRPFDKNDRNAKREGQARGVPINDQIRHPRMQLILEDGQNIGIVTRAEALAKAQQAHLDLVIIAEQGSEGVPIAKIMDYGKAQYAKKKKQAQSKKHAKTIQIKEIKLRPKIGEHDFQTKINQGVAFLQDGMRLKITLMFRGREMATQQARGIEMFDRIQKAMEEAGIQHLAVEKELRMGPAWTRMYYIKK